MHWRCSASLPARSSEPGRSSWPAVSTHSRIAQSPLPRPLRLKAPTVSLLASWMYAAVVSVFVAVFYLPPMGKQCPDARLSVAIINQVHDALVLAATYHPSGCLDHLLDTGVEVGIVVAALPAEDIIHALLYLLVHGIDLR